MTTEDKATPADVGPLLQRQVRPLYYVHEDPNGDTFIVQPEEADEVCEHCKPMYGQAELDAAVAAERKRFPNLLPVIRWLENGCDPKEAAKELRIYQQTMRGPNAEAKRPARVRT